MSYLLRALVRLGSPEAGRELSFIQDRGFRSAAYLEAFLLRLSGGDLRNAVLLLREARKIGKYLNSVIADLAICLKLLGRLGVRRLRALAAARGKRYEDALRDANYLRSRQGGEDTYQRIDAEIKLTQGDYDGAEAARRKIRSETVQDRLLGARILEARGLDIQTPLDQRQSLLNEAAAIRQANRSVDEYDFE